MIIPSPGFELFVADFSKIEVAVLWWLADHHRGLEILRSGLDVYKVQAAENLQCSYEEISDDGIERQTAKAQILGCGFRMSWKKFKDSSLSVYRLKLTNRQAFEAVKNYRNSHQPVTELWDQYENAAILAVESGQPQRAGKCEFTLNNGFLWIQLPSGRKLAYRSPEIVMRSVSYVSLEEDSKGQEIEVEKVSKPKKTLQFMGLDKTKKALQPEFTHGGVLTENIVQATARDLMMPALLRLEERGYRVLLSVYDEGVCEREKGKGKVDEFIKILCQLPPWAEGLPLEAKGWSGPRYRK
jgi:DNA polymerase